MSTAHYCTVLSLYDLREKTLVEAATDAHREDCRNHGPGSRVFRREVVGGLMVLIEVPYQEWRRAIP